MRHDIVNPQWASGRVLEAPFDVTGAGRMAVCEDPSGAGFRVWQPRKRHCLV